MSSLAAIRAEFKRTKSRKKVQRSVSFGEKSIRSVSTIDGNAKNDIWYTPQELMHLNKCELSKTLQCQNEGESDEVTWRGLERMKDEEKRLQRAANIRHYVRTVVMEYQEHASAADLKYIAKSLSKPARVNAHNIALKDEELVLGGSVRSQPTKVKILNRTLSGSISWMKRSQPKVDGRKSSATAA